MPISPELRDNSRQIIRLQITKYFPIHRQNRGQAAATDATDSLEPELTIIRYAAITAAQQCLKLGE
jgi:hypothetical protein